MQVFEVDGLVGGEVAQKVLHSQHRVKVFVQCEECLPYFLEIVRYPLLDFQVEFMDPISKHTFLFFFVLGVLPLEFESLFILI